MKKKLIALSSLIAIDCTVVILSFVLAYFIRSEILPSLFPFYHQVPLHPLSIFLNKYYILAIWLAVFSYNKLYTKRSPFWQETKILLISLTFSFFFVMIIIFVNRTQVQFSRSVVLLAWICSLFLLPPARALVKLILIKLKLWNKKLLILGVHQTTLEILKTIKKNRTMGYDVIGFLDDDPLKTGKIFSDVKVLGPFSGLEKISKTYKSKDIILATPHIPREKLKKIFLNCEKISESMWLIPRSGDFVTEGVEIEIFGNVLSLYIKNNLSKPWNIFIKEIFEKSLAIIILILSLPISILIAIAIKLESKGPAILKQQRIGKNNKKLHLYKFRSMYINNEKILYEYFKTHPEVRKEWGKFKKLKNYDPRLTRFGRIIRKFSLDELPQILNVLDGSMALVGPRPYLEEELIGKKKFIQLITRVKPGITGLWQIGGRSDLPFEERLNIDEYYCRNWSLWLDIVILMKSIKVFFSSKGAY